jgi:hypothetical protein
MWYWILDWKGSNGFSSGFLQTQSLASILILFFINPWLSWLPETGVLISLELCMLLHCCAVYFKNFGLLNDSKLTICLHCFTVSPCRLFSASFSHLIVGLNIFFFYYTFLFAFKDFLMHSHLIILVILSSHSKSFLLISTNSFVKFSHFLVLILQTPCSEFLFHICNKSNFIFPNINHVSHSYDTLVSALFCIF